MTEMIKIWRNRLEISKEGRCYMICNQELSMFIHADKLELQIPYDKHAWLKIFTEAGVYIGYIWIGTNTDMKKVKQFLEETNE